MDDPARESNGSLPMFRLPGRSRSEVAYDEAVELYEQADALDRQGSDIKMEAHRA